MKLPKPPWLCPSVRSKRGHFSRVWVGHDSWTTLALVIDCYTRELLDWHLTRPGKTTTAASALEQALISPFGALGKVTHEFLLRSSTPPVRTR